MDHHHRIVEDCLMNTLYCIEDRLIYVALTKQTITQFKPAEITKESKQQAIRAYCLNIYTMNSPMLLPVWQNAIRKVRKWLSPGMPYELWHMKCATISPRPSLASLWWSPGLPKLKILWIIGVNHIFQNDLSHNIQVSTKPVSKIRRTKKNFQVHSYWCFFTAGSTSTWKIIYLQHLS